MMTSISKHNTTNISTWHQKPDCLHTITLIDRKIQPNPGFPVLLCLQFLSKANNIKVSSLQGISSFRNFNIKLSARKNGLNTISI